jgi:hypothetical protein
VESSPKYNRTFERHSRFIDENETLLLSSGGELSSFQAKVEK